MKKFSYAIIIVLVIALSLTPAALAADAEQLHSEARVTYDAKDYDTAFKLYSEAAELGHANAQNMLGIMYRNGRGVAKDDAKAVFWYSKAAEQGHAWGQTNLAWLLRNGVGVKKDEKKAVEWYRKAADQGNAEAQIGLGVMYENGRGVAENRNQAAKWYRKAADQGNASGQNNMGRMYEYGRGVGKSEKQAAEWYRKAAEQGNAAAQYNLGRMYDIGRGVGKNDKKAVEWHRKSADQGYYRAFTRLNVLMKSGRWKPTMEERAAYSGDKLDKRFPAFSSSTLDDKPVTDEIFAGNKLTMVNIWATWCPGCVDEMSGLARLEKSMPEGTQLVGILDDADDKRAISLAESILGHADADFLQIKTNSEIKAGTGYSTGLPATVFVDSEGKLVGLPVLGPHNERYYREEFGKRLTQVERQEAGVDELLEELL